MFRFSTPQIWLSFGLPRPGDPKHRFKIICFTSGALDESLADSDSLASDSELLADRDSEEEEEEQEAKSDDR